MGVTEDVLEGVTVLDGVCVLVSVDVSLGLDDAETTIDEVMDDDVLDVRLYDDFAVSEFVPEWLTLILTDEERESSIVDDGVVVDNGVPFGVLVRYVVPLIEDEEDELEDILMDAELETIAEEDEEAVELTDEE